MPRRNTKNAEMEAKIIRDGGHLADMWGRKDGGTIVTIKRVCGLQEAINTWMYALAGGEPRALTTDAPSEAAAIEQVHSSERMPSASRSAYMARAAKLGIPSGPSKPRQVVEYSWEVAQTFQKATNTVITIGINRAFTAAGSGLQTEGGGGVVVQIGTPLAWVEVHNNVVETAFPVRYPGL